MKNIYNLSTEHMATAEKFISALAGAVEKYANLTAKKAREAVCADLANSYNPGAQGCIFEIECSRSRSQKRTVSSAGRADIHIKYEGRYIPAECKTNGGRVDSLLTGENKARFVVYRLDFVQKHKAGKFTEEWEERRYISPVIIPTELFLQCLLETKALKEIRHNGKVDGVGIQVSSKKFYERLKNWTVEFNNSRNYTAADFEGLTL